MESTADMMIHLDVTPAIVGSNTFRLSLADLTTSLPIDDASLIRLRFDNLDENLGQSELRPTFTENGVYIATGANLSAVGRWRIRVTIQRPDQFDTVKDFTLNVGLPPVPPPFDPRPPLQNRLIASLLVGVTLLMVGGFLGGWRHTTPRWGGRVLAGTAIAVGALCLVGAADVWMQPGTLTVTQATARPAQQGMTAAVYLTLHNETPRTEDLIRIESTIAARATLHETRLENDIARMESLTTLTLAPFSTRDLAPGGTHLMLEALTDDVQVGQTFDLTLIFASGLTVPVTVRVEE
ncbi:copper chaperone PCu(A)C [bacterium]|nr:copper chaperone PCu(A)C [bacterium]